MTVETVMRVIMWSTIGAAVTKGTGSAWLGLAALTAVAALSFDRWFGRP